MTDRYQLSALTRATPLFVAALRPVALMTDDAADRLDAGVAGHALDGDA